MRSSQTNDCLKRTHSYRLWNFVLVVVCCLFSYSCVNLRCIAKCLISQFWCFLRFYERNELFKEISCDKFITLRTRWKIFVKNCCSSSILSVPKIIHSGFNYIVIWELVQDIRTTLKPMISYNSFCNFSITFWIFVVEHHVEKIETWKKRIS